MMLMMSIRFESNVAGYDLVWGIWDSPGSSNNGIFGFYDPEDTYVKDSFSIMPWLLVNNPDIPTYTGSASYGGNAVSFLGGSSLGSNSPEYLTSLFTSFDVNFGTGTFSNGYFKATTDLNNIWEVPSYSGTINGAFLQSGSVLALYNEGLGSGEIAGAFINSDENNANAFEAFAGGFNFVAGSSESISGLFLIEHEDRLSVDELIATEHHRALIVEEGAVSFGSATHPWNAVDGITSETESPKIAINDRGSQSINSVDLSRPYDEVLAFNGSGPESVSTYVGLYEVDWGYWDSGEMKIMHNQMDASDFLTSTAPTIWANVIPSSDIADRTDQYTYSETAEFLGMGSYGNLTSFEMSFDVDFDSATPITSGYMWMKVENTQYWQVPLNGAIMNDAFVEFSIDTGSSSNYMGYSPQSPTCFGCVQGDVSGIFTGTASSIYDGGGFVSGFSLNNGMGDFIEGVGLLEALD